MKLKTQLSVLIKNTVALKEVRPDLVNDHRIAQLLHDQLLEVCGSDVRLEKYIVGTSTNMVWFKFAQRNLNLAPYPEKLQKFLRERGIVSSQTFLPDEPQNKYRFVVHHYIREA